jgi:hypothetical protein
MRKHRPAGVCALVCAGILTFTSLASGQPSPHPTTPTGGPSSLPPGDASLRGVVADADHPAATGDLTVALYALQPDGTPGIGSTQTSAEGSFAFPGLSNNPAIVYLVGVRYRGVSYGERTTFSQGQREIELSLSVKRPTRDASALSPIETSLQIESRGTKLVVLETHTIGNAGSQPVYVPEGERTNQRPPFQAQLPERAMNFQVGAFNTNEGFEQAGGQISYWGPLYAGEQELRYSYELPVDANTSFVQFERRFPRGAGRIRVLTPEIGPHVESADLIAGDPVELEGRRFSLLESGARDPGAAIQLAVQLPETSADRSALQLGRAQLDVELDDTVLEVTQNQRVSVAAGSHLAGSLAEPLLRLALPPQAQLVSLSSNSQSLGIQLADSPGSSPAAKTIVLLGPLAPGEHDFAFRYRIPSQNGAARLDLQFPMTVPTLHIRAADTGLLIESKRLHRLRPQAQGTRTWLQREAFHVEPDERISIRFEELDQRGPSKLAGLAFLLAASTVVLLFVVSPLRRARSETAAEDDDRSGPAHERDLVYATLHDLEHDFETGKVSEQDYQRSRTALHAQAVELMRFEKQNAPVDAVAEVEVEVEVEAKASASGDRLCPSCGQSTESNWHFCSHCGEVLPGADASGSEPGG